jgi:hypothetical protein
MLINHVSIDRKKYKKDGLPYGLTLLGLLVNVFYFFTLYKNNDNFYYSGLMGISVLYNLIFMLIVFLSAEEIKNYHRKYAVVLFLIGLGQIFRISFYPRQALRAGVLSVYHFKVITVYLCLSALLLMAAAIISFINSTILKRYIEGKMEIPHTSEV